VSDTDDNGGQAPDDDPTGLDALLDHLHRSRGFDFGGYKRSSLSRRIRRRMQLVGIDDFAMYLDYLEVHPDEFQLLFNTILINVTGFFRDGPAWEALRQEIERIVAARGRERTIRIWSAGCASGEEAYTLAIVLAEVLGAEAFAKRVKIYATDIDEEALAHARQGIYSARALEAVPPALVERYFTVTGSGYVFHKELRRAVIFGRHDLVQDAPISRVDVLVCRNTLMYFNAETQTRILQRLNFALNDDGILFLGKAEMLLTHPDLFTPVDLKLRIFARTPRSSRSPRDRITPEPRSSENGTVAPDAQNVFLNAALDASPAAQIIIDATGRVALVNARASALFGLGPHDLQRPFQDFQLSYRPVELRSLLDRTREERRAVSVKAAERIGPAGDRASFDVDIVPLTNEAGAAIGWQVSFVDVTHAHRLQQELHRANVELEAAHEELQSTSEELETTNEELQSTVEELETTNEELQSTNEELETMNEELQSTNEELQTMNDELRQRGNELNHVNAFFASILASLQSGVAVLDGELHVRAWNHRMEDLWGLRADEVVDKHLMNLDLGLPVSALAPALRAGIAGERSERELECLNRRGKTIRCRVGIAPLKGAPTSGVILLVEELGLA